MYLVKLIREEGGYSAIVPALPGCGSQGDTVEEAIHNVHEAIELHVEGLTEHHLPVPPSDVPDDAEFLVAL